MPGAGIGGVDERVIALTPDPDHLVEPASVALSDFAEQRHVGDECGAHPLVPEQVGQDALVRPQRRPALFGIGEPITARPPAPPGRQGRQILGEMVVEYDRLGGQSIQAGRFDPGISVGTQKAQVQAIANHNDDVHGPHCSESITGSQEVKGSPADSGQGGGQEPVGRLSTRRRRFDVAAKRAFGDLHTRVRPVGDDLVAFQFRQLLMGRVDDGAAGRVDPQR